MFWKSDVLMGGEAGAWADEGVNQLATECKLIGVNEKLFQKSLK